MASAAKNSSSAAPIFLTVYCGTLIDTVTCGEIRIRSDHAIGFISAPPSGTSAAPSTAVGTAKGKTPTVATAPPASDPVGRIVFIVPISEFDAAVTEWEKPTPAAGSGDAKSSPPAQLPSAVAQWLSRSHDLTVHRLTGVHQFLVPGFIDCHVHAPQFSFVGTATSVPLMQWLNKYTFPAESKLSSVAAAHGVYSRLVDMLLRNGTTTAVYFATIHVDSSIELARLCSALGQRAFVGKVSMDRNAPPNYCEISADAAIAAAESFITTLLSWNDPLIVPVVTPRFIPTCTPKLLAGLGELAKKYSVPVTSHLSESLDEIAFVHALHDKREVQLPCTKRNATASAAASTTPLPVCDCRECALPKDDTAIFDRFGLLTDRAIMAHCVHLTTTERAVLRARGTGIAHCPLSNTFFGDGELECVKACMADGTKIGLGTDVAGGCSTSMPQQMRCAVSTSTAVENNNRRKRTAAAATSTATTTDTKSNAPAATTAASARFTYAEAFWLATAGGASVVGLPDRIGQFTTGYDFDALIVDLKAAGSVVPCFDETDSMNDRFEKFVNLSDDRNLTEVWVRGRMVKHNAQLAAASPAAAAAVTSK